MSNFPIFATYPQDVRGINGVNVTREGGTLVFSVDAGSFNPSNDPNFLAGLQSEIIRIVGTLGFARSNRRPIAGTSAPLLATDVYVGVTSLAVGISLPLPPASGFPSGQPLYIADESGACSFDAGRTITVSALGSDTIAGQAAVVMGSPYQKLTFHSNGSNLWTYA